MLSFLRKDKYLSMLITLLSAAQHNTTPKYIDKHTRKTDCLIRASLWLWKLPLLHRHKLLRLSPSSYSLLYFNQAHTHASRAAQITSSTSGQNLTSEVLKEASKEHLLASNFFATAIDLTTDVEARRTLGLLRDHHQKLSQALNEAGPVKASSKPAVSGGSGADAPILIRSGSPGLNSHSETPTLRRGGSSNTESDFSPQGFPPLSHHPQGVALSNQSRLGKSTSSLLASNLASKRGIPLQSALSPVLSPATTPGASMRRGNDFFTSNQLSQHLDAQRGPNTGTGPTSRNSRGGLQSTRDATKQPEAGYNRFYSSLETFVSRIGSPLAGPLGFAGMDLVPEVKEASSPTTDGELIDGSTVPAHPDKDGYSYTHGVTEMVQNLMPKAWWSGQDQVQSKATTKTRSIFGGAGGGKGVRTGWQGGNESYYVVPTSKPGQVLPVSYAAVAGRVPSPSQDGSEEYSPLRPKKTDGTRRARSTTDHPATATIPEGDETKTDLDRSKTMEELMLENHQLRQLTDNLSRRLHTWEVNARDSRAMLDRSLMLYRNKSGDGASFGSSGGDERSAEREKELQLEIRNLNSKLAELETELEQVKIQLEKEQRENKRSTKKANYYKEKWDKLKEDARAKELRKQQEAGGLGAIIEGKHKGGGSRRASMDA